MDGGTAKLNIDHLVYLGITTKNQAHRWKELQKQNPKSKCMICGNKIKVTSPISKTLQLRYFKNKHIPEVHWIFNFQLNSENLEAVEQCKNYIKTLNTKQKQSHLFPCCYRCWNIAVNINKDYYINNVELYYKQFQEDNPNYINWNSITLEECQNEEQKHLKITQYYEYIKDWCNMVNICCYTDNGLKYCSKYNGKCIHTNPNIET